MWFMIPSLADFVRALSPAFTQPSFTTHCQLFLAWVMCLGRHQLYRVAQNVHPQKPHDHSQRHGFDTFYNFFERSSWTPKEMNYHILLLIMTRLRLSGDITLLVDDTLAHKRGRSVWGLGWFLTLWPPPKNAWPRHQVITGSFWPSPSVCPGPRSRSWPDHSWLSCTDPERADPVVWT